MKKTNNYKTNIMSNLKFQNIMRRMFMSFVALAAMAAAVWYAGAPPVV